MLGFLRYITGRKKRRKRIHGWVYIIEGPEGWYKIGKAKEPSRRLSKLEVELPFPIEVKYWIESDDYSQTERELHKKYADKRGRGEWFALSKADLRELRRMAT